VREAELDSDANPIVGEGSTAHRVVAAAVVDREGRVLIAQRPPGKWQAGRWEFPGGKLEAGEDEQQALRRELEEELGIHVRAATRVLEVAHNYPDRSVVIALWLVLRYDGTPTGLDGQALRWVEPGALTGLDLLEADLPMLPALLGALGLDVPR
jgi:8-oxo-dGTP diphosphatase